MTSVEFITGKKYLFSYKGNQKKKICVGKNERGIYMFDHLEENRRSFVDKDRIVEGLKIEKITE